MKKYTIYSNFCALDEVSTKKEAEALVKSSKGECWYKLTEPTLEDKLKKCKKITNDTFDYIIDSIEQMTPAEKIKHLETFEPIYIKMLEESKKTCW